MPDRTINNSISRLSIVAFRSSQYAELSQILSRNYQEHNFDADGLAAQDACLPSYCKHRRWVGLSRGVIVAFGEFRQTPLMFRAGTFCVNIVVHPAFQRQGIGSLMYSRVISELRNLEASTVRCTARADHRRSTLFLEQRGFRPIMHIAEWCHNLREPQIDQDALLIPESIVPAGLSVSSVTELAADSQRNHRLYDLFTHIHEDVPLTTTPIDYDEFIDQHIHNPCFNSDSAFVALQDGRYVGYTELRDDGNSNLYAGLTGVLRDYRRQGVGFALKMHGIQYGGAQGYKTIKTFSAANNLPICSINARCGFTRIHDWSHFEKCDLKH